MNGWFLIASALGFLGLVAVFVAVLELDASKHAEEFRVELAKDLSEEDL